MNRERVPHEWVGRGVVVRLTSVEAQGEELLATLVAARDDGVSLSRIGERGCGPVIFYP